MSDRDEVKHSLPILIVGAGPTGLALAIELARRGVAHRLIEKLPARSDKSRALALQARTLELMRGWGVSEALVARGRATVDIQFVVDKKPVAQVALHDIGVDDTPYPFVLLASQVETETLLDAALAKVGGVLERNVELIDARDEGESVAATLRHAGGRLEELRASYVIGCDGAHSKVRHLAALEFEGAAYQQDFVLADVTIEWAAPNDQLLFLFGKRITVVMFPLRDGRSRVIGIRSDAPPSDDEPTLDEVEALLNAASPWPARLVDPRWVTRFRLNHRGVDRYRRGRLFVAGDAAHIHSPAGGQGMNTGIQDAVNLAWKLARVNKNQSPPALLDSYDEERRPVGERLLEFTDRLFALANTGNPILSWARNKIVPLAVPRLMATASRRRLLFRFISELAIEYGGSSIVMAGAGRRAPDAPLGDGKHLYDAFASPLHHLIVFGDDGKFAGEAAARWKQELDVITVDDALAKKRYGARDRGWVLVRPDCYVAAEAHALDDADLDAYFNARIGSSASKRSM